MTRLFPFALAALALAPACSTVDDVIAYGKGPFDHEPLPRSETALEGLHESSWGNSGKWGAKDNGEETSQGAPQDAAHESPQEPPREPLVSPEPPIR